MKLPKVTDAAKEIKPDAEFLQLDGKLSFTSCLASSGSAAEIGVSSSATLEGGLWFGGVGA